MNINDTAKSTPLWFPLIGFINPVTALMLGVAGFVTYKMVKQSKKQSRQEPPLLTVENGRPEPLDNLNQTVESTVNEPLETAIESSNGATKQEIIRQAMSELGKRSAEARAKKRMENNS